MESIMPRELYRYVFTTDVSTEDIEITLLLAILAVESLHGEVPVRLDAKHHFDTKRRTCIVDATTAVGRDLNRLFAGFARREYGEDSFHIERVDAVPQHGAQTVSAGS
jgi:hypothetical protein